jgi:hypothetical protein
MNNGIIWKTLELKSTRNYGGCREISGYQGDALDLDTSGKEFEMCAKSQLRVF